MKPYKPLSWFETDSEGNTAEFYSLDELQDYWTREEIGSIANGDEDTPFPWSDNG